MREIEHLALYRILIVLFLALFVNHFTYSQRYPNQEVNMLLDVGIEYLLNQNYDLARVKFNLLNKKYPELPFGKIYLAATDMAQTVDYGDDLNSESITKFLNEALELSEKLLERNPANIWNHYFVALSKGYKSYLRVIEEDWLAAITSGLSTVNYFEDCLEMDSSFYESYVAIGTYKFWKSRKLEFLEWLPFFDDKSEEGIRYLELALNKTSYNRKFAAISLIWIYIENKNFNRAIEIAENELKKNPLNRALKWGLARAYEDVNPAKAIQLYSEIVASYQKIPDQNHYQEITLKHIIAQQYLKIGENREALRLCDEILAIKNLNESTREKLSDRLKRVIKMRKELTSKR